MSHISVSNEQLVYKAYTVYLKLVSLTVRQACFMTNQSILFQDKLYTRVYPVLFQTKVSHFMPNQSIQFHFKPKYQISYQTKVSCFMSLVNNWNGSDFLKPILLHIFYDNKGMIVFANIRKRNKIYWVELFLLWWHANLIIRINCVLSKIVL